MKSWAIAALLTFAACSRPPSRSLSEVHREASALLRQGETARALALAREGQQLAGKQPDPVWPETFRLLRAEVLLATADAAGALAELSKPLPATPEFAALRVRRMLRIGHASMARSLYPEAVRALEEARRDAAAAGLPAVAAEAEMLRGVCLLRQNKMVEAEALLRSVIGQARKLGDAYIESGALLNLGVVRQRQFRYDEAAAIFQRLAEVTRTQARAQYPYALVNLSVCLARLGEFEKAIDTSRQAIALLQASNTRLPLPNALGESGNTYLLKGEPALAVPYLERALELARELKLPGPAALWAGNLAAAHTLLSQWDAAERFNEEAARMKKESDGSALVYNTLNSARIAMGRGDHPKAAHLFRSAIETSPEDPSVSWDANAGLAAVSIALLDRAAAATHFEAALGVIERTRADLLRTDSKIAFLNRLIRFYRDYVETLLRDGQSAQALVVADSSRTQLLGGERRTGPASRATPSRFRDAARRSGAVVLAYWLAPERSYVWVVAGNEIASLPLAASDVEIASLANAYRASIEESLADPMRFRHPAGAKLHKLLIEPVRKWLPPGSHAIVVPDGALHNINFETLPVYREGAAPRFLIEDVTISLAPSVPVTVPRPPRARSLLLVGDPVQAGPEFPPLRHAAREVDAIAARFLSTAVVRRGADATPAAFREAQPRRFSTIHFAAHAAANRESPLDSALILAPHGAGYKLYARDLNESSLDADLVTISACRGAGARVYSGEGLVGFAWALLHGGARNVIAGLWDVNDLSTAQLMDALYAGLAANASPESALREAKLKFIRSPSNFRKPYYWGPFLHYRASR